MIDGNEMLRLINLRQSDRKYSDRPVEKEKIDRITEAGRMSPSACNGQPWRLVVIDDPELRDKVADATESKILRTNMFVRQAPVLIVIIREKSNIASRAGDVIKNKDYSLMDIGILTASMVYQATAEGLGTCIIGWLDDDRIRKVLSIPRGKKVELIVSVGYTEGKLRNKIRKPPEEIISYNGYR